MNQNLKINIIIKKLITSKAIQDFIKILFINHLYQGKPLERVNLVA